MDDCTRIREGASRIAVRFLVVAKIAISPKIAISQTGNDWVGKRVVQKSNTFALRIESQVVERSQKSIEIYHVEQFNNGWLWLKAEGQGLAGWATVNDVVPVDDAITFFTNQIRANPGDASSYRMRALIWREVKKELDIALGDYNEALRLDPSATSYICRGNAWRGKKEYDKAIADYNEAIRLDPNDANAYNGRAWLWATCPDEKVRDGKKAVESAKWACELTENKDSYCLDTLAASYAETGDFDTAVKTQETAIGLLTDAEAKKDFTSRLELYRARKSYRLSP